MAKRKKKPTLVPMTSGAASPPVDYAALLAAVGQAHRTAQRHAVRVLPRWPIAALLVSTCPAPWLPP